MSGSMHAPWPGAEAAELHAPGGGAAWPLETRVPVVVLASTPYAGMAIARSLGRRGVAVHGVHPERRSPAARSRFWRGGHVWDLAAAPPERSLDWLLRLGRSLSPRPVLFTTDDRGCLFVADHAEALREAFVFPAQPPGLARALSGKEGMDRLCRAHGVPTPATVFPRSREDVERFARAARFPVVVKGIYTQLLFHQVGERLRRVEHAAALLALYDGWAGRAAGNLMLQEAIPGGCDRIWMLSAYFGAGGRCLFGLTGRKLREFPIRGGVTSFAVCEPSDAVLALATRFMQALGYRGILDLDFKLDARTGEYLALDANPRVGANFRLFVDALGTDVVQACYRDLTGQPVPQGAPRPGRKWMVEDFDGLAALAYGRRGQLGAGAWLRSLRGVEEAAWFARDDPLPLLSRGGWWLSRLRPSRRRESRRRRAGAARSGRAAPPAAPAPR